MKPIDRKCLSGKTDYAKVLKSTYITGLIKLASVPKQPKLPGLFGKAGVALRAFPARRAYTCKDQVRGR